MSLELFRGPCEALELARSLGVPVGWQTNLYLGRDGKRAACGSQFGQATPKLAKAKVSAVAAGRGRYGMILWVKAKDYARAARALPAR